MIITKVDVLKKWKDIIDGKAGDNGINNCILCHIYYNANQRCDGCPIYELTGLDSCKLTPYSDWNNHQVDDHNMSMDEPWTVKCQECINLAGDMLEFLENVVPDDFKVEQLQIKS